MPTLYVATVRAPGTPRPRRPATWPAISTITATQANAPGTCACLKSTSSNAPTATSCTAARTAATTISRTSPSLDRQATTPASTTRMTDSATPVQDGTAGADMGVPLPRRRYAGNRLGAFRCPGESGGDDPAGRQRDQIVRRDGGPDRGL